ncbi:MAG: hypothetical protein RBS53_06465 [Bacteroidales bacterium]|nr:hypothetical protein [Bacteroidales bacterium]NLM92805.1 hypothetical protein [Bacteroidales bacterium]
MAKAPMLMESRPPLLPCQTPVSRSNNWSGHTSYLNLPNESTAVTTMPASPITLTGHFLDATGISEAGGQGC